MRAWFRRKRTRLRRLFSRERPAQERPAPEKPAQETPAQETPAQETPAQETPAPETPAPETPAQVTHAQETQAQETPAQDRPAPERPAQESPAPETQAPETPAQVMPAQEAKAQETPAQDRPAPERPAGERPASSEPTAPLAPLDPNVSIPRPEIGDDLDVEVPLANPDRTAEIAANAPRYRRKSSTFIDAIHDVSEDQKMAPAQLYSTMSGRLFHSGRIAIVMVGLPARGKTHICVSMARYLSWLGVKTRIFHLGDYRRATVGPGGSVPEDYFFPNASPSSVMLRQKILKKCREDIYAWLNHENGQVAIYDAVNPTAGGRRSLAKEFAKHDVQTLFLESYVDDEKILRENARNVKIHSPDFHGMDPDEAAKLYLRRIEMKIPVFETMGENDLNYVKMINAGQAFFYNNVNFNYLSHRIVFYLTNLHIKSRTTFFVRAGAASEVDSYKADGGLSEPGYAYAIKMTETLIKHREQERQTARDAGGPDMPLRPLTVWTSTRLRAVETAAPLQDKGYKVRQRSQMSQINPGDCEKLSERTIRSLYPKEVEKHELDPYHHRYPRAESYHDLAVRLEPIILELEREQNDLLIIAHESVLRVLYGYLMHCSAMDIPKLKFPRDEIIEIIPAAYQNEAKRIHIPGLDPRMIPGSPEDIRIPVPSMPPSGTLSPIPGMSSPIEGQTTPLLIPGQRPPERVINNAAEIIADKVADED